MEKKIIGIFVCTLFIISGIASATIQIDTAEKDIEKMPLAVPAIAFGIMKRIDMTPDYRDYEVTLFAMIIFGGNTITYNPGEFIRLYYFRGLDLSFLVLGFCDDWGVIG